MFAKRTFCFSLIVLLLLAVLPCSSVAESISSVVHEARMHDLIDVVWARLNTVELQSFEAGAANFEVTLAVYKAALTNELIDNYSISDLNGGGFSFKISGMACCYDYKIRNAGKASSNVQRNYAFGAPGHKSGPSSRDVLLVGPYYGFDENFSDQYIREAAAIAEATGGSVTELSGEFATAPAVAEHAAYNGIVIFDSHGAAYNGTSYLCLTSSTGITSSDYSKGWAINGGTWFGIDGRYIENHTSDTLPFNIFWMAICEGMKLSGAGVTGEALLRAGAGCVYGYSQSVSFYGDYIFEAAFWSEMRKGATVAEAFTVMTDEHGFWDPAYSSPVNAAWPIVMSNLDSFPEDPDSHQAVNCDWRLFGGSDEPVALEGYSLSETAIEIYQYSSHSIRFTRTPINANGYRLEWESENESIALVSGNNTTAEIEGVSQGRTNILCRIYVGDELIDTAAVNVNVLFFPTFLEAANVEGGDLPLTSTTALYPWQAAPYENGFCVKSGNAGRSSTQSIMQLVAELRAGDILRFRMRSSCESGGDCLGFYANNTLIGEQLSGNTEWADVAYTAQESGRYFFQWRYLKNASTDRYDDCGYVDDVELLRKGDVDSDKAITAVDALMVLRYSLSLIEFTDEQILLADIDLNGTVTANDALMLLRLSLDLI